MSGRRHGVSERIRPAAYKHTVLVEPGSIPRNGLPVQFYEYGGQGGDEPAEPPVPKIGLRMSPACWDDICDECTDGRCACACHDEPDGEAA